MNRSLFLFFALVLLQGTGFGQVSFTPGDLTETFDFTGFLGTGFDNNPTFGQLDSDTWRTGGWGESPNDLPYGHTMIPSVSDFGRGIDTSGDVGAGGVWAFDIGGNVALGAQPTASEFTPGFFELRILNNTNQTITGFDIAYDLYVYNDNLRSGSFNFSYFIGTGTETLVGSLDYTSLAAADSSPAWVHVNSPSPSRSTSENVSWNHGDYAYFRWTSDDAGGTTALYDQFALDNVSVTGLIPEPSTYALIFGGFALGVVLIKRRFGKAG